MPIKKIKDVQYIDLYEIFSGKDLSEKELGISLLERAYREIYLKTFPVPSEREAFEDWQDNLFNLGVNKDVQSFSLFGFDLDGKRPSIIGLIVTSFYTGSACGLIDYVIRKREYSKTLPASVMLELQEEILKKISLKFDKKPLKMILWEANDPQHILWDDENPDFKKDCMKPQKRIDHIKKAFGCRQVGIAYAQAPICDVHNQKEIDKNVCKDLLLFLYKAKCYSTATADDLERFFTFFSKACNGHFPVQLHNQYIDRMMRQVAVMKQHSIPLLYEDQTEEQRNLINNA